MPVSVAGYIRVLYCSMIFSEGLKRNPDYRTVYRKGRSFPDGNIVVHVRKNGTDRNRIGISASKKCGNSVIRHGFIRRIKEIYRERYEGEPLINVASGPSDGFLYSDSLAMTDRFEIMVMGNSDRVLLVSRFDNLGKGASGAAIQNMNIVLGLEETAGLCI